MTGTAQLALAAVAIAVASLHAAAAPGSLHRYEASRMSMACLYAIEAYGPAAGRLPLVLDKAFDEVDRIDRLMSHYKSESPLSQLNREAGRHEVAVDAELYVFIAEAMRYYRESGGAFDITVGPLMKAWGFFRGDGRVPSDESLATVLRHVGGSHVRLNPSARTIVFDEPGVELDLGGIAKGYAVDRVAALLRQEGIVAALISAGGSSVYGLGAPPGRESWDVQIQDPIEGTKIASTVTLKNRALSVAGSSEKSFEKDGVTYSHIMDPRLGRPVQGILSVAVLTDTATAGDALDDAFFVLGPEGSRTYLKRLPRTEVFFFLPAPDRGWTLVTARGPAK